MEGIFIGGFITPSELREETSFLDDITNTYLKCLNRGVIAAERATPGIIARYRSDPDNHSGELRGIKRGEATQITLQETKSSVCVWAKPGLFGIAHAAYRATINQLYPR